MLNTYATHVKIEIRERMFCTVYCLSFRHPVVWFPFVQLRHQSVPLISQVTTTVTSACHGPHDQQIQQQPGDGSHSSAQLATHYDRRAVHGDQHCVPRAGRKHQHVGNRRTLSAAVRYPLYVNGSVCKLIHGNCSPSVIC